MMTIDKLNYLALAADELEARGQQLLKLAELLRQVNVAWMEPKTPTATKSATEYRVPWSSRFDAPAKRVRQANVLASLAEGGSTLKELSQTLGMSSSSVAPHLSRLREAGLVTRGEDKRYRRADPPLAPVEQKEAV
jgi:DNA-binding transcriptional ArsR family regulator